MISLSHKEFEKTIVKGGEFEVYTQEQFDRYINANLDLLKKGEFDTLSDIEKSEYEALKEEIKGFGQIEVVSPSKESDFRIEKAIMYVRPAQVEWDEHELIKSEDGTEIMKARGGRYTDTPTNRKLGRVGQRYGKEKKEPSKTQGKTLFEDNKNTFKVTGLRDGKREEINSKPLTKEDAKEMMEDAKRSGLYSDIRLG